MSTSFGEVLAATGLSWRAFHQRTWRNCSRQGCLCRGGMRFPNDMRLCCLIFAPSVFRLTSVGTGLAFPGEADQPLMKVERVGKIGPARKLTSTAEAGESDALAAAGEPWDLLWEEPWVGYL